MESKRNPVILRRRSDFLNLAKNGRRSRPAPWMVLNYRKNDRGYLRCGWTIPRKVGSAVYRNRIRRWCREFFRSVCADGKGPGLDVNIVITGIKGEEFKSLRHDRFKSVLAEAWSVAVKKC